MPLETSKYLYDIQQALELIDGFCTGKTFQEYQRDAMLRSAVERQFEIVGEAVSKLAQLNPSLAEKLTEYRRIIAFRNILIHAYAAIDDRIVWGVIEGKLPRLRLEATQLLSSDTD